MCQARRYIALDKMGVGHGEGSREERESLRVAACNVILRQLACPSGTCTSTAGSIEKSSRHRARERQAEAERVTYRYTTSELDPDNTFQRLHDGNTYYCGY